MCRQFSVLKTDLRYRKIAFFQSPFVSEFSDIWPQEKIKKNGLVSVLALMAYVNAELLKNLDFFSRILFFAMKPPPPISEKCKLFLRSPFVHHLIKSEKYLKEQWVSPGGK
jgi:hypothetical protein